MASGQKRARLEDAEQTASEDSIPSKMQKQSKHSFSSTLPSQQQGNCLVYIINKKISSAHLSHLKKIANKKGFALADVLSDAVTHIVTVLPSYERAQDALPSDKQFPQAEIVTLEWLTTSFAKGLPIPTSEKYRVNRTAPSREIEEKVASKPTRIELPEYECQRPTLLQHHNHRLTDALEALERFYQYLDHKQGDTRALAFRQASCVLKAFPRPVESIDDVAHLHRIGRHSKQVIEEVLTMGFSTEVEDCKKSDWFKCMELFTLVYGCGPATADHWYKKGLRSIEDMRKAREDLGLSELQKLGLKYFEHLSVPVTRQETEYIVSFIKTVAETVHPGTSVEAVGGFRRGKQGGHDVDLLLSHESSSVTETLLEDLVARLTKKGVLVHCSVTQGHNTHKHMKQIHSNSRYSYTPDGRKRVKFDNLDKAFCILSLESGTVVNTSLAEACDQRLIRRVDLIVSPPEQYPFALVSWTGSKQFNRSLRRYSVNECNKSVTAHGIFDIAQGKFIAANTEKEVFSTLGLDYLQPTERNC